MARSIIKADYIIRSYSSTTNANGNLTLNGTNDLKIFGATIDNQPSTMVICGKNSSGVNMLCFRDINTGEKLAGISVEGYIFGLLL